MIPATEDQVRTLQRIELRLAVAKLLAHVALHYGAGTRYKLILPNDVRAVIAPDTETFMGLRVEWNGQPNYIVVAPEDDL